MNIEQLTCTIEQAKALANFNIGEDYNPLFVWVPEFPIFNDKVRVCHFSEFESHLKQSILSDDAKALVGYYPAYTLGELMRMLPEEAKLAKQELFASGNSTVYQWSCQCEGFGIWQGFQTPEIAAADLVILLLETQSITPEQCNAALQEKGGQ